VRETKRPVRRHMTDILFALLVFSVFLISALMMILIGIRVYRNTAVRMTENFGVQTSISYVTTKIHQNDRKDAISVTGVGGTTALVIEEQFEDTLYRTWIYYYDGSLREVFAPEGTEFEPESGTEIIDVAGFTIEQISDQLYQLTSIDTNGTQVSMTVATRC
jgi:hypothetical protein